MKEKWKKYLHFSKLSYILSSAVIPDNIDKAMEDVLKGILDSPDERMSSTKNLIVKSDKGRSKNSGNKKKIIRILLPVAAVLGVSTGVLATKLGWLHKELEQQGVTEQEAVQMVVTEPDSTAENVEDVTSDRKSTRLNSSHLEQSRMPSSA